jgi:pilus assembly protein Flp/PilA
MNNLMIKLFVKFQDFATREEGQDLVEYALVVALIAFGATAAMKGLSNGIANAFNSISTQLSSNV